MKARIIACKQTKGLPSRGCDRKAAFAVRAGRLGINIASQEQHWGIFIGDEKLARRYHCKSVPHIESGHGLRDVRRASFSSPMKMPSAAPGWRY